MAAKRKAGSLNAAEDEEPVDPSDRLRFLCLGGGNEVGRSCHIIQYKGKTVMLDAGMHPAYDGLQALPYFDEFDLSEVDILLISHFHIDHAASLPYVLSKTNFRGRVFMTHSTKAIYKWLIQDSVRVGNQSSSAEAPQQLYTEADHLSTFPQIEAIDYYTTHTVSSIRITPYPAGHVLGAAMFLVEIAGLRILFTGDYSREQDRHLIPAQVPTGVKIDVLITESTFGISTHVPRAEREAALMKSVTSTLNRGGRVLMPVFALGRAQELLLILDEYWGKHPEYRQYPIYYASALARKCMIVYQTYIGSMNDNIKNLFKQRMAEAEASGKDPATSNVGPWDFRYIRSLKSLDRFEDVGGCVMLASPGMLQSGVSRELLERWAPDSKNGVIITGYSIEGTMARMIIQEPDQIQAVMQKGNAQQGPRGRAAIQEDKVMIPRRCSVAEYSFAAHVDGTGNREFIEEVGAPVVILVHGERHNMTRLKSKLLSLNANKAAGHKTKVYSPANCEDVYIPIRKDKTAKVVGSLAERIRIEQHAKKKEDDPNKEVKLDQADPEVIRNAVLVQNDLKLSLMAVEDLREYAGLTVTTIMCRQKITLASASLELILWALEGTFGGVAEIGASDSANIDTDVQQTNGDAGKSEDQQVKKVEEEEVDEEIPRSASQTRRFLIMDTVRLTYSPGGEMEVEWEGGMMNDGIADAVMAVLMGLESSPAAVKQSSKLHSHSHDHDHSLEDSKNHDETEEKKPNGTTPATTNGTTRPRNPHTATTPQQKLQRLLMFLEAQFGSSNIEPFIIDSSSTPETKKSPEEEEPAMALRIKVDDKTATVHLADLKVECSSSAVLANRVRAVVERAAECVAPLWDPAVSAASAAGLAAIEAGGAKREVAV